MSASRGSNDVDALVMSSNLSVSAPEFVPTGFHLYEVRGLHHLNINFDVIALV